MTLSADVTVEPGKVSSASVTANGGMTLERVDFQPPKTVLGSDRLCGSSSPGGALTLVGGVLSIDGCAPVDEGSVCCGALLPATAAQASFRGIAFDVRFRQSPADRTCSGPNGTTSTSTVGEVLAALPNGVVHCRVAGSDAVDLVVSGKDAEGVKARVLTLEPLQPLDGHVDVAAAVCWAEPVEDPVSGRSPVPDVAPVRQREGTRREKFSVILGRIYACTCSTLVRSQPGHP